MTLQIKQRCCFLLTFSMAILSSGCDIALNAADQLGILTDIIDESVIEHQGPASCSVADYNDYLYDYMKSYYYWYDQVDPNNLVDPGDTTMYPTSRDLLAALRYDAYDHFSGIADASSFSQFYGEGAFLGVGLRLLFDDITDDVLVAFAYENSPAAIAGIQRGDRIVSINSTPANGLTGDAWNTAWGADTEGTNVTLEIERPGETTNRVFNVTKEINTIITTQKSTTFNANGSTIGYLHFTNFLGDISVNELNAQFDQFNTAAIDELVIDLRYNGGGSVGTANHFGNLIANSQALGNIFTRLIFNDNPLGFNGFTQSYLFDSNPRNISLNRVFFITTESTCSASELLINSLAPHGIEVIVIGDTTCGKPVGFRAETACGNTLLAVNFESRNSNNVGEYYSGISSGYSEISDFCAATDDLDHLLGNSSEASLAMALNYMQTGQCALPRTVTKSYRSYPGSISTDSFQFDEGMY